MQTELGMIGMIQRMGGLAALGASTLILAPPAHATDGYFLHGVGAKAKGVAGVAIALPQDSTAIASNPALATEVGHRVDVGVDLFIPDRGSSIRGNAFGLDGTYSGNGANPFVLGDVAYTRPLSERVSIGLAMYANGGMNTVYRRNPFAGVGATGDAGVDLKQAFFAPTVALRLAPRHSVGVSAIGLVQSFKAYGIAPFSFASAEPTKFSDQGTDWSTGIGFKIGYYGRLSDWLSVGATYQSKVRASRFDDYAGLFPDHGDFDVPASWGVGISVKPVPSLTVGADFKRIEYRGVGAVGNSIAALDVAPFGAKDGPGFGWRDISVFKVGAIYDASARLTLRAGYGRSGNPVPSGETLFNVVSPGIVQDHFTLGGTWAAAKRWEVSAHALLAPRNDVKGHRSIPAHMGGGEANIRLAETSFGIAVGHTF